MDTKPIYLDDSYKKTCTAKVLEINSENDLTTIVLDQTIFYPVGGGQPSDQGTITGKKGKLVVEQVLLKGTEIKHIGKLEGEIKVGEAVECHIDWDRRYHNMKVHSAGHILHEAVKRLFPELTPIEAEHGKRAYIKYEGNLDEISQNLILNKANEIISQSLPVNTEFVSLEELKKRSPWVPAHLPTNKPLRIMWIGNYPPIPDGGTQVKSTSEVGSINYVQISNEDNQVLVIYKINDQKEQVKRDVSKQNIVQDYDSSELLNIKNQAFSAINEAREIEELERIRIDLFGKNGSITSITKELKNLNSDQKKQAGILINEIKKTLEGMLASKKNELSSAARSWFDPTMPGKKQKLGHLHMVTKAIEEISSTFEKIGFTRVRYPEVEWDYFAFGALNFPDNHPARDDWETFFVDAPKSEKYGPMLLTPHTSSGQIREMLKRANKDGDCVVRMINIAKTYRRQIDVSHYPMFHQFEGLVVDKNISITHLRGTIDYFAKSFFGPNRVTRLRPYHFQFTEPSFEVDISCNVCGGRGCKLCKEGWLEIGGAGMVHPNVLKNCRIDPKVYSGFAFGWGVERTYMMKSGLSVPDIRFLYSSDLRVLKQL